MIEVHVLTIALKLLGSATVDWARDIAAVLGAGAVAMLADGAVDAVSAAGAIAVVSVARTLGATPSAELGVVPKAILPEGKVERVGSAAGLVEADGPAGAKGPSAGEGEVTIGTALLVEPVLALVVDPTGAEAEAE